MQIMYMARKVLWEKHGQLPDLSLEGTVSFLPTYEFPAGLMRGPTLKYDLCLCYEGLA